MRTALLGLLLLVPALPGCVVAAAAATTVAVVGTTAKNQPYALVTGRTPRVWASAKCTLAKMSSLPIAIVEDEMRAQATIDNHKVLVSVRTYDLEQSEVRVEALQLGMPSAEMGQLVLNNIVNQLNDR